MLALPQFMASAYPADARTVRLTTVDPREVSMHADTLDPDR